MKKAIHCALLCTLASCATQITAEQLRQADIGKRPKRSVAEQAVRSYFDRTLKDPASARIRFGSINKASYTKNAFSQPKLAWRMDTWCNARNSFGGYTGAQLYTFYFRASAICAIASQTTTYGAGGRNTYTILVEVGRGGRTMEEAGLK